MYNWTKTLIIVRGLPGEGKSTLALSLVDNDRRRLVENDDYWMVPTFPDESLAVDPPLAYSDAHSGPYFHHLHPFKNKWSYEYEMKLTHLAGEWCGAEAFRRLRFFNKVAVANTFIQRKYILEYLEQARSLQIRVQLHRPTTEWSGNVDQCVQKNIHNVPPERIKQMNDSWEDMTQNEVDIFIGVPKELRQ